MSAGPGARAVEPLTAAHVLLVADTHLGPGQGGRLLARIGGEVAKADLVLHAGDVTDASILDALGTHGAGRPVRAVRGNNDHDLDLPERVVLDIGGCTVAMIHDSGAARGRTARLRRWFPAADVVVFGHSHLPWHTVDRRAIDDHVQHHVNPGSPMLRRRAPACSVARLVIDGGAVAAVQHVSVADEQGRTAIRGRSQPHPAAGPRPPWANMAR